MSSELCTPMPKTKFKFKVFYYYFACLFLLKHCKPLQTILKIQNSTYSKEIHGAMFCLLALLRGE